MLARRFLKSGCDYLGLDLFDEMLNIARKETGESRFVQGDMRELMFDDTFDAVLITGRSIAYVTENRGIMDTLTDIHRALKTNGLLVFDLFEAGGIFEDLKDFEQDIIHNGKRIRRISRLKRNMKTGWTWGRQAKYIIETGSETTEYDDLTTLRSFTKDEILLFLKLTGFNMLDIIGETKAMTIVAGKYETHKT
jgi:SAM-dependent methyltransferase